MLTLHFLITSSTLIQWKKKYFVSKAKGLQENIPVYKKQLKAADDFLVLAQQELNEQEKQLLVQWRDETVNVHQLKVKHYLNELKTLQSQNSEQAIIYAPLAKQQFENVDIEIKELNTVIEQLTSEKQHISI